MKRIFLLLSLATVAALLITAITINSKSNCEQSQGNPVLHPQPAPQYASDPSTQRKKGTFTSVESIATQAMPKQDLASLLKKAEQLDAKRGKGVFRFAEPIKVDLSAKNSGTWKQLPNGNRLWNLRITSEGADSINFGFERYRMPEGGRLTLFKTGEEVSPYRDFTAADNKDHGQLWTPMVKGDDVILEVELPAGEEEGFELALKSVNHGFRDAFKIGGDISGSCNIDVACTNDPTVGAMVSAYSDQIRSVAAYMHDGIDTCSGALINNTNNDGTPYFLTAQHCGISTATARTVVAFFNFENSTCRTPNSAASGQVGNGGTSQFVSGATLRAVYAPSDFCLIEFEQRIPTAYSPYFAGWDRTGAPVVMATGIHHPAVAEKRISFVLDDTVAVVADADNNSGTTHYRIKHWDYGTTEGGSSGSPLFNQNGLIIGDLTGGRAACGNSLYDVYGALSVSWTGGGTPATSLSSWLDPVGNAPVTLDGINQGNSIVPNPLQDALDNNFDFSNITFTPWFLQTVTTQDGVDAAQSGQISDGESSDFNAQITTTSPDTLNFYWKVSSEANFDFLRVFINANELASISGDQDWAFVSIPLPVGTNTIRWSYEKDSSVSSLDDTAWIDLVSLGSNSNFTAFEQWFLSHVPNGYQSNLANEDYDGDCLTNIEEYAFSSNPSLASSINPPRILVTQTGQVFTQFLPIRTDVDYRVHTSPNLINWATIATNPGAPNQNANVILPPAGEINGKQYSRVLVELK